MIIIFNIPFTPIKRQFMCHRPLSANLSVVCDKMD